MSPKLRQTWLRWQCVCGRGVSAPLPPALARPHLELVSRSGHRFRGSTDKLKCNQSWVAVSTGSHKIRLFGLEEKRFAGWDGGVVVVPVQALMKKKLLLLPSVMTVSASG